MPPRTDHRRARYPYHLGYERAHHCGATVRAVAHSVKDWGPRGAPDIHTAVRPRAQFSQAGLTMANLPSRRAWQPVRTTPWLVPRHSRPSALTRFLATTWRLPTWVPASSARHEISTLLPRTASIAALLRALHGRLLVVNRSPVAAFTRGDCALLRGLVHGLREGMPSAPWCAPVSDESPHWPVDSRATHAAVLAHEWLSRHDPDVRLRTGTLPHVALALFEGPATVALAQSELAAPVLAPDVRARVASRLPGRALSLPRVVAAVDYRLVVVATANPRLGCADAIATAAEALESGRALGPGERGAVWFSGNLLIPDPALVAVMDAESRRRWAGFTGRAGRRDTYWYPESWARFGVGSRGPGCVVADVVARSHRTRGRAEPAQTGAAAVYAPDAERGVCVPPGYGLVDCVGTLGVQLAIL